MVAASSNKLEQLTIESEDLEEKMAKLEKECEKSKN